MQTSKILTLTMNPAVDISTAVQEIVPLHKLRCEPEQRFAGGGGINVARAVHHLGGNATAVFPAGGVIGQVLQGLVSQAGVQEVCLPIANETREDFAITENSTGKQFRFVMPGPMLSDAEALACVDALLSRARAGDFVVASGSLPRGVRPDFYGELSDACSQSGARFILDCPMPTLANSLRPGVFLIKPSFSEFKALTGVSPLDEGAALGAIRNLIAENRTNHVALTLGDRGAWLVGPGFALAAAAPSVKALSGIGAGDSFLAGLVLALASGQSPPDSLRNGVAAGTAALLAPGVELCKATDFDRLKPLVVIRELPS